MEYLQKATDDIQNYLNTHPLPIYFYDCFFGELVKIFGTDILIPNKNYDAEFDEQGNIIESNEKNYSYKDQLDFYLSMFGGTAGWGLAFKETCKCCNLMNLYFDYLRFDWVRSDIFDGYMADHMLDVLFTTDTEHNQAYYKFKMDLEKKEKNKEKG